MTTLNESPLFNLGGTATVLSFFGINVMNVAALTNINIILIVIIGLLSLFFTAMKMYHQFIVTRELKRKIAEQIKKGGR